MNTRFNRYSTLAAILAVTIAPAVRADAQGAVQILSATVRDQKITGATVTLQKNGDQSVTETTGLDGRAELPTSAAADPNALVIVRKPGYSDLVAKCPCAGMTYALSPFLDRLDAMRVVLNWGSSPHDLDGHLAYAGSHVFFNHKVGEDAQQDIDHMDGYGPETITISRRHEGTRYVYAVQDYSNRAELTSTGLSESDAKVFIYVGQTLVRAYYVPQHRQGNVWKVFSISEAGEIQDINTMSTIDGESGVSAMTVERIFGAPDDSRVVYAPPRVEDRRPRTPIPDRARKQNTQGEAVYRDGQYVSAIADFRAAIDEYPDYGQAYSNLGLAFQKSGRVAEALWANRKAIALADGPSAATTRASTHFNNGRIYEDARQFDDALREYLSAAREKSNTVYDNAIARMRQSGAH
ncbi:MAG TPA: hypothetical protein VGM84_07620 [Steroidobacteraceae bacterium]